MQNNPPLAKSQISVINTILKLSERHPSIIVVRGFSNTGKSMIIDHIEGIDKEGSFLPYPYELKTLNEDLLNFPGNLITSATPYEFKEIEKSLEALVNSVHVVDLRSMCEADIKRYILSNVDQNNLSLSTADLVTYSLGVLLVADMLIGTPNLTKESAALTAAEYLITNLRGLDTEGWYDSFRRFLGIRPPDDVIDIVHNLYQEKGNIYDWIDPVLDRQLLSAEKREESPLFVAPESVELYSKSLEGQLSSIQIHIPNLTQKNFMRVMDSLGFDKQNVFTGNSNRMHMFAANYRKVGIFALGEEGQEYNNDCDLDNLRETSATCGLAVRKVASVLPQNQERSITLVAFDHDYMIGNPLRVGWMVESLLQHIGVTYMVDNRMCGVQYVYNPLNQNIENIK